MWFELSKILRYSQQKFKNKVTTRNAFTQKYGHFLMTACFDGSGDVARSDWLWEEGQYSGVWEVNNGRTNSPNSVCN